MFLKRKPLIFLKRKRADGVKNWCQAVWSDCVTAVGVLHMRNLSEMADIPLSIPNFVKFVNLKFYEINWLQTEFSSNN